MSFYHRQGIILRLWRFRAIADNLEAQRICTKTFSHPSHRLHHARRRARTTAGRSQNPGGGGGLRPMDFGPALAFVNAPTLRRARTLRRGPRPADPPRGADDRTQQRRACQKLERARLTHSNSLTLRRAMRSPSPRFFADAIKYGELANPEYGHTRKRWIPGSGSVTTSMRLWLTSQPPPPAGGTEEGHEFQARLKHRDPASDWAAWGCATRTATLSSAPGSPCIVSSWIPPQLDSTPACCPCWTGSPTTKNTPAARPKPRCKSSMGPAAGLQSGHRSGPAGRTEPAGRTGAALSARTRHRPDRLQVVWADGGGDWDGGGASVTDPN